MKAPGVFFLIAGPSGAGKTTVLKRLLETSQNLVKDVSVTTRPPREGEVDGRDYRFWEEERFEVAVAEGAFLEHAVVHGVLRYGTLRSHVEEQLAQGVDVVKDIDVQGLAQVRRIWPYPRTVAVFVAPPSQTDLEVRLKGRGTESSEAFERRLMSAQDELRRAAECDYLVVNRKVESAAEELACIRRAEHLRWTRREKAFRAAWKL